MIPNLTKMAGQKIPHRGNDREVTKNIIYIYEFITYKEPYLSALSKPNLAPK